MKTSVKAISFLLMLILCVNLLVLGVTAKNFEGDMVLTAYNTADNQMISIGTTQTAGAVAGKLVFDSDLLTFDPEHTVCAAGNEKAEDMYYVEGNTITFMVVADDLTNGADRWIDFAFVETGSGMASFSVSDAQVSDVEGNVSGTLSVAPVQVTATAEATEVLGAQYRPATEENGNVAALRFGAKVKRNRENNKIRVDGEEKTAVYCGFILGFEGNIQAANGGTVPELEAKLNRNTGNIRAVTSGAILSKAAKAYESTDNYLIHTVAITGIGDTATATIGGVENVLIKDAPIIARAYVVYQNADGSYGIAYSEPISRTFSSVAESYAMVEG